MGGDRAPGAILDGALLACERGLHPEQVLLVGDEDAMGSHLESVGGNPGGMCISICLRENVIQ